MKRSTSTIQLIAAVLFPVLAVEGQLTRVVSPSGFEDMDGDMLFMPINRPYPKRGPQVPNKQNSDGWRAQELHLASSFELLGDGPFTITGMAWRPDISVNEPISTAWELTLRLSTTTTQPDSLSNTFVVNHGDDTTQVYSGNLPLETDGVPRGSGLPHEFDYVVQFDTPYQYDPTSGNLLVEFVSRTEAADTWAWIDADSRTSGFVFGSSTAAKEALINAPGLFVTQFHVVPKSSTSVPATHNLRSSCPRVCRAMRPVSTLRRKWHARTARRIGCRWNRH